MSTTITFNGQPYVVPAIADASWGAAVSSYLIAIAGGSFQKTAGNFTLTAEAAFGGTYGLKSVYFKTNTATPATTGVVRFANAEGLAWRNMGNSADLALLVNSSNALTFGGVPISALAFGTANQILGMNSGATAQEYKTLTSTANQVTVTHGTGTVTFSTPQDINTTSAVTFASVNKLTLTPPATSSTFTLADGKTLTVSNTLTVTATDGSTAVFGVGGTVAYKGLTLAQFASTTSAQLLGVLSDATGTGKAVFATAPTFTTSIGLTNQAVLQFFGSSTNYVAFAAPASISGNVTWTLPATDGSSNQLLSTNGLGVLSWASGLSTALNQFNVSVGNSSNVATSTNTALLGDISASTGSQTLTVTIAVPGVATVTTAPATGSKIYLTTTGALPTGLTASTTYWVINVSGTTFKFASTQANALAGTAITTTGSQSGIHTMFTGGFTFSSNAANAAPAAAGLVTSYVPVVKSTVKTTSASYVVLDTDGFDKVLASSASAAVTITLPLAANNAGRSILVIQTSDADANNLGVTTGGSDTLDGVTNGVINIERQWDCTSFVCDGTSWFTSGGALHKTSFTLDGSFTGGTIYAYKYGPFIVYELDSPTWTSSASPTSTTALATAFRPSGNVVSVVAFNSACSQSLSINSNGTVSFTCRDWAGTGSNQTGLVDGSRVSVTYLKRF